MTAYNEDEHYSDHSPESFGRPIEIRLDREVLGGPPPPNIRLYMTKFKSGSPEARSFFLDPLRWMRGEPTDDFQLDGEPAPVSPEALESVSGSTRIASFIANHHATLRRHIIYSAMLVDSSTDTVSTLTYKEPLARTVDTATYRESDTSSG